MNAIKMGIVTPTVQQELKTLEGERSKFEKRTNIKIKEIDEIHKIMPIIKQSFTDILNASKMPSLAQIAKLRTRIKMILGHSIVLSENSHGQWLKAEIKGQYSGLLKLSGLSDDKLNLVAGVGFEPTTFRL